MSLPYTPDRELNDNYTECKCDYCDSTDTAMINGLNVCNDCYFYNIEPAHGKYVDTLDKRVTYCCLTRIGTKYQYTQFTIEGNTLKSLTVEQGFVDARKHENFIPIEENEYLEALDHAKYLF